MDALGGLETGGTWFVAAVGTGPDDIRATARFPTTTPDETLAQVGAFFDEHGPVAALGIGSFGPADVDPASPTYGHTRQTPKAGWSDAPVAPVMGERLGDVPVVFDTDVNAAALGEHRWGAGRGVARFAYLTVGTGVGAGIVAGGRPVSGPAHPELGHLPVRHDGVHGGTCPFHGDCLEGLASGPAMQDRWGVPAAELPDDHPAWAIEADLIAQGLVALRLTAAVTDIVLAGGVGRRPVLLELVRARVDERLNGYLPSPRVTPPGLGERSGVLGAIALAAGALATNRH